MHEHNKFNYLYEIGYVCISDLATKIMYLLCFFPNLRFLLSTEGLKYCYSITASKTGSVGKQNKKNPANASASSIFE